MIGLQINIKVLSNILFVISSICIVGLKIIINIRQNKLII